MMRKNAKTYLTITSLLVMLLTSTTSHSQIVSESSLWENWDLSFGINRMAFYADSEADLGLSSSPFRSYRSAYGAAAAASKWLTPTMALRTKATGYWGKAVISNSSERNKIKFFTLQEQLLMNATNMIMGYDPKRSWDVIPYGSAGFIRDCTHNDNSLGIGLGVMAQWSVSNQIKVYADLGVTFAGSSRKANDIEMTAGRYRYYSLEVGISMPLGLQLWGTHKERNGNKLRAVPVKYEFGSYRDITPTDSSLRKIVVEENTVPTGMMLINRGHIRIGTTTGDSLMGISFPSKDISVDDYFIDRTEVTNQQYRAFVKDVYDSIVAQRAAKREYLYSTERARESVYRTNAATGEKTIDVRQLIYAYETYDYSESMKAIYRMAETDSSVKVTIAKDTAYIDSTGTIVRQRIIRPYTGDWDFLNTYIVNIYPDTTCWVNDFPNADNERYARYYFTHPDYNDYPVVGVSWQQANAYCAWRTERMRKEMGDNYAYTQPFRLPTEAEWEYAARARNINVFPWQADSIKSGMFYANFQPENGDYAADGNIITARVGIYPANDFGLYDMAGNVAEWTSTTYTATGVVSMNNINPELLTKDEGTMAYKTVKGGSWKDAENMIQSAWRIPERKETQHSYIGFRCVRSIAATPSEKTIVITSKKR